MIDTSQLTPATPRLLLPCAPIVPATWLPWPLSSSGVLSLSQKSQPFVSSTNPLPSLSPPPAGPSLVHTLGARSWLSYATPLSMTATITPLDPIVVLHACGASMSASLPRFSPQSSLKRGSFRVVPAAVQSGAGAGPLHALSRPEVIVYAGSCGRTSTPASSRA